MTVTVVSLLLRILAAAICTLAVVGTLGIMFWHWHKELDRIRLKHARSTQVR
jgi:hypothetical protein